MSALEIEKV